MPWLFHATVLAAAAGVLLFRSIRPGLSRTDHAALAATSFALLAMRGALGRADAGHLLMHGVFAALPAAWLLYCAAYATYARWLLAPLLAAALLIVARPFWIGAVIRDGLLRREPAPGCERALGESGRMPCAQADELEALRAWIDREVPAGQTFFDYGNEPALYFLFDRRPPTRFSCGAPCYEGEPRQREVINALERERPPVAILASGSWRDTFDEVSSRRRTPLVAEYLDRHYDPLGRIGTRTVARRRTAP